MVELCERGAALVFGGLLIYGAAWLWQARWLAKRCRQLREHRAHGPALTPMEVIYLRRKLEVRCHLREGFSAAETARRLRMPQEEVLAIGQAMEREDRR